MKELVLLIAKALVDNPDKIDVKEIVGEKTTVVELKVADGDKGKIIGKEGRIIKAIRIIVNSASAKLDKRATVEVVEWYKMKSKKNYTKQKVFSTDIVGFEVFDQNGKLIGILSNIMSTSGSDVWIVKCCNEEILIPALRSVVREVNVLRKKIFVVLPKEYEDVYSQIKSVDDVLEYNTFVRLIA